VGLVIHRAHPWEEDIESMLSTPPPGRPIPRVPRLTVLDTIVEHKWGEIAAARAAVPEADLDAGAASMPAARDFTAALLAGMRVIAEVKKASPSAG